MAVLFRSLRERWSLAKHKHPILFWSIFTLVIIIMFVPALVLGLFFHFSKGTAVTETVDLGYAKYQGTSNSNGVSQWLGIRYAQPPLRNLRFRAPADPLPNITVQIADSVSSSLEKEYSLLTSRSMVLCVTRPHLVA